jgi:hypothetical protein
MGKMQRDKGKRFERHVAQLCREALGVGERTLTQQRDSGEAPDVMVPGWWIEAKHHQRVSIRAAYEQAVDEATRASSKSIPVAVTKDNGKPVLATLDFGAFLMLLELARLDRVVQQQVVQQQGLKR